MTKLAEIYGKEFLKYNRMTAKRSAELLVPLLYSVLKPNSVVDFGCAEGSFLDEFYEIDPDIFTAGYDGPWIPENPLHYWTTWDVEAEDKMPPLARLNKNTEGNIVSTKETGSTPERYDVALCLEVAEHLPKKYAHDLVYWLCQSAHTVVFSGAVPKQGGTRHINCQWQSWWGEIFQQNGFEAWDFVRPRFWEGDEIDWWYTQNTIVYTDPEPAPIDPSIITFPLDFMDLPLNLVHPGLWDETVR